MEKKEIPYGYVQDGHIFRVDRDSNPVQLTQKEIQNEEETVQQLCAQYDKFYASLVELENKINGADNKGSYLMKLLHIKDQLPGHMGLGDYQVMGEKVEQLEGYLNGIIEKNRKRNTEIKNVLLLELDEALKNNDLHEAGEKVKDIRSRWIKTGNATADVQAELEQKFNDGCQNFYNKKNEFQKDKQLLIEARIAKFKAYVEELDDILSKDKLLPFQQRVKSIQKEWKEIGSIPQKDFKALNDRYWNSCQNFFAKVKEQRSGEKKNAKETLQARKDLIEQLQGLNRDALKTNLQEHLNQIKTSWKEAGRLKKEEMAELNDQFYELIRVISEKQFIQNLAPRRFKDYGSKSASEKRTLQIKLIQDLLRRDQQDLKSFQENMDNMHVNKGSFVDMLTEKLENQRKKVVLKKQILGDLKADKGQIAKEGNKGE